jgi:23S rRNA (uracil1939-C5)-methyltransferase
MSQVETPATALTVGQEVDLTVEKLAFGGKALGRVDGCVVFVEHALPGQKARVRITRKKARFAEAEVVELIEQSPAYEPPFCPHFGLCGGCQWQDLAYPEQLRWKRLHLEECLEHLAGVTPGGIRPTAASPETRGYRNKMEFTFAPRAGMMDTGDGCALGLHVWSSSPDIFNLEHCFLQSAQTPQVVREVRAWCRASGLPAYNAKTRRGFWRFLVLREGKGTGHSLAHLITTDQGRAGAVAALARHLRERFPGLTTFSHSRNTKKAQVARGKASRTLWGPGYIEAHLGGLRLQISANSFLQPNTLAAEGLYEALARLGEFSGHETVWDLYCGAGSIGLYLAPRVGRVVGFELEAAAVADARRNSLLNGADNCRFLAGDLKERIREAMKTTAPAPPDVVIADPPRAGLHPEVVQALLEIAPRRLLYVSCNPATLARDLARLKGAYEIAAVQPFDFFPHTPHLEALVSLKRR